MNRISDPFDFERVMEIVREYANDFPHSRDSLIRILGMLIDDALGELKGEKFDYPRSAGDLDDADGICHLLTDYPPIVQPNGFWRPFLNAEEEAAARFLLKLYSASEAVKLGYGLPGDVIHEIETEGRKLLSWRLHGPAFQHGKDKRKLSRAQQDRASGPRKKNVTKQALEKYREEFIYKNGQERGWKTAARLDFGIDLKTLNKRMDE